MGEALQARQLGGELSSRQPKPAAVEIAYSGGSAFGIAWLSGGDALLLIHDSTANASSDDWGAVPEAFTGLGYQVLAIDLPGFGGSPGEYDRSGRAALAAAIEFLRESGARKLFALVAGGSLELIDGQRLDALVSIAPDMTFSDASRTGAIPKLIIVGSSGNGQLASAKAFAQACRGWTLLSTFACDNRLDALLHGPHARQVLIQIAGFLHDYQPGVTPAVSKIGKRIPR